MGKTDKLTYEVATSADISGILAVQQANYLPTRLAGGATKTQIESEGFLIHKLWENDWMELLASPDETVAFVCKDGATIVGYGHGYPLARQRRLNPGWTNSVLLHRGMSDHDLFSDDVLYYRQGAVLPTYKRRGIGSAINARMVERARYALGCRRTLGEILKKPYLNRASYPPPGGRGVEIGEIVESYNDVIYTWGLVKYPMTTR